MVWDRSPYATDGKPELLKFKFWADKSGVTPRRQDLMSEMRWILFVHMWLRPGNGLANKTLQPYLDTLRRIARACEREGLRVRDVLINPDLLRDELSVAGRAKVFLAIVHTLRELGPQRVGFAVAGKKSLSFLVAAAGEYRDGLKQTAPIPTRIYSLVLAALSQEVHDYERVIDAILEIVRACVDDPCFGIDRSAQSGIRSKSGLEFDGWRPGFPEVLRLYGLSAFWEAKGYLRSKAGLLTALLEAQVVASLQVQAFTGMRLNEVSTLPYNCLEQVHRDGATHLIVKGRVTKLTHGKIKLTQWVTSASGREAILLAQRISRAVYNGRGDDLSDDAGRLPARHLFVHPAYLLEQKDRFDRPSDLRVASGSRFKTLRAKIQPIIEEHDLMELKRIDPHRNWSQEKDFRIGAPWKLKSHQFRRSLALYAQRSGLVSLPTLKRQLQHITQEMSLYYARGSAFAGEFIGAERAQPHFGQEWREAQPLSQYLAYAAKVLCSEDADLLYGGHIQFIRLRCRDKDGSLLHDRDETIRRFQRGEIAWKPTPIGGCVNPERCDMSPIDLLNTNCVANNCRNMVGHLGMTERVIRIKARQVEALRKIDPESSELRHEEADLGALRQGYELAKSHIDKSRRKA
ncbi:hypothetical protein [Burkholderia stagnalis]|nr:hypothetical protein [Burkholderia stagnalis]